MPQLAHDDEIPAEVLEFFVPEVEEHLQAITDCLLALEANPNAEDIHRLFRSMHTIKGRLRRWAGSASPPSPIAPKT